MKRPPFVFLFFTALFGIWFYRAYQHDNTRLMAMESTTSPSEFVKMALNDPDAQVTEANGTLNINYFKGTPITFGWFVRDFYSDIVYVISKTFEKFPSIHTVGMTESLEFSDIRGNKSRGKAISASFTRDNFTSIHWDSIDRKNIPDLADGFWKHRALRADAGG